MATTVVRVYETEEQALDAASKLEEAGFAASTVLLVTPEAPDAAAQGKALGLRDFVAEQVAAERSVVAVRPPFGQARLATAILDGAGPLAIAPPKPKAEAKARTTGTTGTTGKMSATPLSDLFGWKVLSDRPTPMSDKAEKPVLMNQAAPLSDKFGWSTRSEKTHFMTSELSNNPAPLSSSLGMRLLSDKAAPLSDKFGWSTRSEKTHYLTSELSNNPTPLSSKLGLAVLSEKAR